MLLVEINEFVVVVVGQFSLKFPFINIINYRNNLTIYFTIYHYLNLFDIHS
jgi:hypothetical protein